MDLEHIGNDREEELAGLEQCNIRDRVNKLVEGARMHEERKVDNGEDGRIEVEVLEQANAQCLSQ